MKKDKGKKRLSPAEWFKRLPVWGKGLIINGALLLLLTAAFFMIGTYLYGPAKTARAYYEARTAGDWNAVYDCCTFPRSPFLSRRNFVNANAYAAGEEAAEGEPAAISSFMMRKKGGGVYQVSYSLEGEGESHTESLALVRGERVLRLFYNWSVAGEDLYAENVVLAVPKEAHLTLDGIEVEEKYETEGSDSTKKYYEIPYLFKGYHTLELKEEGKENFRKLFEVQETGKWEFFPELQLNNKSGKEVCERAERALDEIYAAAAAHEDFSEISSYFSGEERVQKKAEEAFRKLSERFSTKKKTGIATLSVTSITTAVQNEEDRMHASVTVRYTAEKVKKRFFFFYDTEEYEDSVRMEVNVTKENGKWVFDEALIAL